MYIFCSSHRLDLLNCLIGDYNFGNYCENGVESCLFLFSGDFLTKLSLPSEVMDGWMRRRIVI